MVVAHEVELHVDRVLAPNLPKRLRRMLVVLSATPFDIEKQAQNMSDRRSKQNGTAARDETIGMARACRHQSLFTAALQMFQ